MKLGIMIPWNGPQVRLPIDTILRVESLGYDSLWSAEAYGSDAITPLAYVAALTRHLRLAPA